MPIVFRQNTNPSGRCLHLPSVAAESKRFIVHNLAAVRTRRLRRSASPWTIAFATARLRSFASLAGFMTALLTVGLSSNAVAECLTVLPSREIPSVIPYGAFVTEAAYRFAIPERWIRTVMRAESGGNAHAISSRGALGLMQIMPESWVQLGVHCALGVDSFHPHDNILAGAAYLREMLDRFRSRGFLAAYNADPQHYAEHLATGRPLPGETEAYVAKMKSLIEVAHRERRRSVLRHAIRCQNAPAFIEPFGSASADDQPASVAPLMASSSVSSVAKLMTPLWRRAPQICLTDLGQLGCPAIPVRGRGRVRFRIPPERLSKRFSPAGLLLLQQLRSFSQQWTRRPRRRQDVAGRRPGSRFCPRRSRLGKGRRCAS